MSMNGPRALLALGILLALPQVQEAAGETIPGTPELGPMPPPLVEYDVPAYPPPGGELSERAEPAPRAQPTFEDQVVELINQERWENGRLSPLKKQDQLDAASEEHSAAMGLLDFFAHCNPVTNTFPDQRAAAEGYLFGAVGENIAAGQTTPRAAVDGWMASPGHRANILSEQFAWRETGIGYVRDAGDSPPISQYSANSGARTCSYVGDLTFGLVHYWTQMFGLRSNVYPVVIDREAFMTGSRNVSLYIYGAEWGATEMRIRNENGAFTPWMPFATDYPWTLSAGNGTKTVTVETRNGGTVRSASDTIELDGFDPNLIFSDGFESGNTAAWALQVP